jgi:uncharacterized protein YqiB (DUF1249 family)
MGATKKPGAQATRRASNSDVVARSAAIEIAQHRPADQYKIPPRAVLARRWPKLRINRFTGKWLDEKTGRRGDDLASLSRYLGEPRR